MKSRLVLLTILAFITGLLAFTFDHHQKKLNTAERTGAKKKLFMIRCSPDWNELGPLIDEMDIPPVPGTGTYKWKISTKSDSAQFYFNQGINMYYCFHIIEAMASFKKASRFDPSCGMLEWARALAYGPNINDLGYAASPDALTASDKAIDLSKSVNDKERMLILAQRVRYSEDSTESRTVLNQNYVDRMKEVYDKYPSDPDVAALYADALMLQHPWDLWNIDGTPQPWTPRIRQVLEKLLAKTPNHPGANHYYIHVMEPSPFAAKAIPSADRLSGLTPGLSHTVHMPSHIYLRTGNFNRGITVNEAAVKSFENVIPLYDKVTDNAFLYLIHNLHMKTNHAMLAGRSVYSAQSAKATRESIPDEVLQSPGALGNAVQYIYMTPLLSDVRFGKWESILEYKEMEPQYVYANLLLHFGQGMALAAKSRTEEAKKELDQVNKMMTDTVLAVPFSPFSSAFEGATVAWGILAGTIALKEKRLNDAIQLFKDAVITEEHMVYNEPRDWLLNPKQYLGNAYLKAGKAEEAIKTFKKDLETNMDNGWSLYGLWQACSMSKKAVEANQYLSRYKKAFEKADIKPTAAVY